MVVVPAPPPTKVLGVDAKEFFICLFSQLIGGMSLISIGLCHMSTLSEGKYRLSRVFAKD